EAKAAEEARVAKAAEEAKVAAEAKAAEEARVAQAAAEAKAAEAVQSMKLVKASVPSGSPDLVQELEATSSGQERVEATKTKAADVAKPVASKPEVVKPAAEAHPVAAVLPPKPELASMYHAGKKPEPISLDFKFTIQIGSFLQQEGALKRASDLRHKGYDAYVLETRGKREPYRLWQTVRLGRFQDRKTAQEGLALYRRMEHDSEAFVAQNEIVAEEGGSGVQPKPSAAAPPAANGVEPVVKGEAVSPEPSPAVADEVAPVSAPVQPVDSTPAASPVQERGGEVAVSGESAEHLFQQSLAFRNNRDVAQEELLLRQALQVDASHGLARNRLARILVESHRGKEGLQVLQAAVQGRSAAVVAAEDPNLAAFLAALYQRQESHEQAVAYYQNLLQQHPDKGIWRMGMAISLEKLGKSQQALEAYQGALADESLSAKLRGFVQTRVDQLK
ncbi:MAG: SPOR domain-containing protein, partial [Magnetococcales bacterium]|nr:SPOR domain-containing protein [Magnetococcales bacterium]